jgi:hypothetical protein
LEFILSRCSLDSELGVDLPVDCAECEFLFLIIITSFCFAIYYYYYCCDYYYDVGKDRAYERFLFIIVDVVVSLRAKQENGFADCSLPSRCIFSILSLKS